jgi:hypothetical protein
MERLSIKHLFILLLTTMILSSCGGGNSVLQKKFSIGALVAEEHAIDNNERNIATRICYAYQSKSNNFRTSEFLGSSFNFSATNTDCQGSINHYQIKTNLQYETLTDLIYAPQVNLENGVSFNKKAQTDRSGYLSVICAKIVKNESISNTLDQAGVKVQISFFHDGLDSYELKYFTLQSNNSYKVDSAETFKVRSAFDFTAGNILGMDESYKIERVCNTSKDSNISKFEQTFNGRLIR